MTDLEELKQRVRRLQSRAATSKTQLHDLAECLPNHWTEIVGVAEKTFDAFAQLDAAKRELAALENSR
ncbi:CCE_0567 family metalloprotein [Ensifer aridi]|uniref:CCE_0567 family metalloprotein n=1 Tax=Ensifer aridi TaxID=1708715 RepID=UPI00042162F0|nr:CCE_0567 family metalloprotein [Ensifer aridi]